MIPQEIQFHIESYLDDCRFCHRKNIPTKKIYCDIECYYIYKQKELSFFLNTMLLYAIMFVYGNWLLKVSGAVVVFIAIETLF